MDFDTDKYQVYTWKSWWNLHWIINPVMAVNELLLGQRVPEVSLLDKTSVKPALKRTYVPCPHCGKLHDNMTWSSHNGTAFKNWFGLYCYNCGGIIPCLKNWFSLLLLTLTYPVWGWFKGNLKKRWLEKQPARYKELELENVPNPFEGYGWVKQGLQWGLFMFIIMTFIFPFFIGEAINWKRILVGIPVWTLAGLLFGFSMKLVVGKTGKK